MPLENHGAAQQGATNVASSGSFSRFTTRASWLLYNSLFANLRRNLTYELVSRMAAEDSAALVTANLGEAVLCRHRRDFWRFILGRLPAAGEISEIGAFQGASVNMIADSLSRRGDPRLVHGFDAFEGLEEDWSGEGLAEGCFNQGGRLPEVRANVRLHKGWVQDTLAPFLATLEAPVMALVHIDTDIYTPARHILETVKPHLVEGSLIVFDELIGYPNWRAHEYRALMEVPDPADHDFIGFTSRQAAIRMKRRPA